MIYIETPRLLLRDWTLKDIEPFARLNSDSHVMKYFLKSLTKEESKEFLRRIKAEFSEYGYGLYAVERKDNGEFLGFTGFHNITFDVDFAPGVEIGWRIIHEAWNKGYVTEAAIECLEYAKRNLVLDEIYSFTSALNKASERVMQKIGMHKVKEFHHPNVPEGNPLLLHVLYKTDLRK